MDPLIDFYQVSLKVFLKNSEGKYLVLKCIKDSKFSGFHEFPGGRIDINEVQTPFGEILGREIREEIGNIVYKLHPYPIAVNKIQVHVKNPPQDIRMLYLYFEADYIKGDITISHEHIGYEWIDLFSIPLEKWINKENLEGAKMYVEQSK